MFKSADLSRLFTYKSHLPICRVSLVVALLVYFYLSVGYFLGAGRDDTFITLWTGEQLAQGNGLINHNFEQSEISSSLLHTFVVAIIYLTVPENTYGINKLLGLITGALLLISFYQKRHLFINRNTKYGFAIFNIMLFSITTHSGWLYWNLGGLETPYQTLILFLYASYLIQFWHTSQDAWSIIFLQLFYILVRPEGFLIILFTCAYVCTYYFDHKPISGSNLYLITIVPLAGFLLVTFARYAIFGLLFPNPVYAKVGLQEAPNAVLYIGLRYLKIFYTASVYSVIQAIILSLASILYVNLILCSYKNHRVRFEMENSILVGLILWNHSFVLLVGGDWMEFSRFIVPVVPLIIIFTVRFTSNLIQTATIPSNKPTYFAKTIVLTTAASVIIFAVVLQVNRRDLPWFFISSKQNCSLQMGLGELANLYSIKDIDKQILNLNCAYRRDKEQIAPFIENVLPQVYQRLNTKIIIATYQLGFFPYSVRKAYPKLEIQFIDTMGLDNSEIARLKLPKTSLGLADGTHIDRIIDGKAGVLSEYVLSARPNMIYLLKLTSQMKQTLENHGWILTWEKPNAYVFVKQSL